jgi:nicotinamidase-related amidase
MRWARSQPADSLQIVHVRDWHDDTDDNQRAHLDRFGAHCVRDTTGARLVLDLDDEVPSRTNERTVDALGLNDFEETDLGAQIAQWRAQEPTLRVGVVGVWTDAKVSFLLYDLLTRGGVRSLATCSALTASASRSQHFNALEQLERLLGVEVHHSVGEFARWLVPDSVTPQEARSRHRVRYGAEIVVGASSELPEADHDVVAYLYREAARVQLNPLSGGFSGAAVYAARSSDAQGHELAPTVVKLGEPASIGKERAAFERVEPILGNVAPTVRGFVDLGDRAGLKYAFASMGEGGVRTFKGLYESGADADAVADVLKRVFAEVLGRFTRAARTDRLAVVDHYGFAPRHADAVVRNATRLGPDATEDGEVVAGFYRDLDAFPRHPFATVSVGHGDLNGANILIDDRDNVWLIDFFHAAAAPVHKDLVKLENDLQYIFTPIADERELSEAFLMSEALSAVRDLRLALGPVPDGVSAPALRRAWATIAELRRLGADLEPDGATRAFQLGALRYAAHTLSFDESSPLQRRWALHAAASHVRALTAGADLTAGAGAMPR